MMCLQCGVVAQSHTYRLAAAIHRHQVDIDVDQQVGFRRPPVDAHVLAVLGDAKLDHAAGRLGIVVVELVRIILPENAAAHGVPDLERLHAPME